MAHPNSFAAYFQHGMDCEMSPSEALEYAIEKSKQSRAGFGESSRASYRVRTAKPSDFVKSSGFTDEDFQPERFRKGGREGAEHNYSFQPREQFDESVFSDAKYPRFRYAEPQKKFYEEPLGNFSYEEHLGPEPRPHHKPRRDSRNPATLHKSSHKDQESLSSRLTSCCFPGFSQVEQHRKAHRKHQHAQQRFEEEFGQGFRQSERRGYIPPSPPRFRQEHVFENEQYTYTMYADGYRYRYQQPGDYERSSGGAGHTEMPQRPPPTHHQPRFEQHRPRQPQQPRTERPRGPSPRRHSNPRGADEPRRSSAQDQPLADYYAILGVSSNATPAAIKKAYVQLALKYHPDRVADGMKETLTAKMADINVAYGVLSDEEQRRKYDLGQQ